MTCAAEDDDRIVAYNVSAQVDICTSDESYSMKCCKDVEERRALMQHTFFFRRIQRVGRQLRAVDLHH